MIHPVKKLTYMVLSSSMSSHWIKNICILITKLNKSDGGTLLPINYFVLQELCKMSLHYLPKISFSTIQPLPTHPEKQEPNCSYEYSCST
jgi:hypothetical protein